MQCLRVECYNIPPANIANIHPQPISEAVIPVDGPALLAIRRQTLHPHTSCGCNLQYMRVECWSTFHPQLVKAVSNASRCCWIYSGMSVFSSSVMLLCLLFAAAHKRHRCGSFAGHRNTSVSNFTATKGSVRPSSRRSTTVTTMAQPRQTELHRIGVHRPPSTFYALTLTPSNI